MHLEVITGPEVQWNEILNSIENMGEKLYLFLISKMLKYLYVSKRGNWYDTYLENFWTD